MFIFILILEAAATPQGVGQKRKGLHAIAKKVVIEKLKKLDNLFLHVDGKQLDDIGSNSELFKRLAIVCTTPRHEHLISIPNLLPDSTAATQVATIRKELDRCEITSKIVSVCYDTAAVNTGWIHGVGVSLERNLNRKLLKFPCRHHFYELVIMEVFKQLFGSTTGPFVLETVEFSKIWKAKKLNDCTPVSAIDDEEALEMIESFVDSMGGRLEAMYDLDFARDDYKELIELSLIFLGKLSPRNLKPLGPLSNARWMGKLIFVFKKYLLRDFIDLDKKEAGQDKVVPCFQHSVLHFTIFAIAPCYPKCEKRS